MRIYNGWRSAGRGCKPVCVSSEEQDMTKVPSDHGRLARTPLRELGGQARSRYAGSSDAHAEGPGALGALKQLHNQAMMEFQQAIVDAEVGLTRYTDLYDYAPVGYFTLDRNGSMREVNLTGASLLGLPRAQLVGSRFGSFVTSEFKAIFDAFLAKVFDSDTKQVCEIALVTPCKSPFFLRVEANANASSRICRVVVEDITEHRKRDENLRLAASVLNTVGDGVIVASLAHQVISVNPAFTTITGYEACEVVGQNLRDLFRGPQQPDYYQVLWDILGSTGSWQGEVWNRHKDGNLYVEWFALRLVHDERGKQSHYVGVFSDITERKLAEKLLLETNDALEVKVQERTADLVRANALLKSEITERMRAEDALLRSRDMLRQLAIYQERIKEEERKRIAWEIHDDLGQNLLVMRIDASMLHARTATSHPRLHAKVGATLEHIDITMKSLKAIINDLRPAVLDLGLVSAIEWHVQQFERRSGIVCDLEMVDERQTKELEDERTTALFRILQESLANVSRHARASRVQIALRRDANSISIRISDNGTGITPEDQRKTGSFGLLGMRERINAMGGQFVIERKPDGGTKIVASLPIA